jgi:hypothetical protein
MGARKIDQIYRFFAKLRGYYKAEVACSREFLRQELCCEKALDKVEKLPAIVKSM